MQFRTLFVYSIISINLQLTIANKPYSTSIESFASYTNTGNEYFDPKTLRVNRKGKNEHCVTGNFAVNTNLGHDSMMTYEVFKKSDSSDKYSLVMKGGENICKFCATNRNFYPRFRTYTNFPDPSTCPFPKGNYTINDYTIDDKVIPIAIPSGTYLMKVAYTKDGQNMFGYRINVLVTPG